jgi:predicted GNAT superfamily acetyltransferase
MADPTVPATTRRALRARRASTEAPAAELVAARAAAQEAMTAAGIAIHEVQALADLAAVRRVFDTLWLADPTNPAVTVELLRAYAHTGQYVVIATDATETGRPVIAAGVGFLAAPPGVALHSNVVGVLPEGRGRSLGFALKLHQRAWAMARGLSQVTWTFDPLIRRNAWFNLTKLAARPVEYLIDFYGPMADGINVGDASDRLFLTWPVGSPAVLDAVGGRPSGPDVEGLRAQAAVLLSVGADGRSPSGPVAAPGAGAGPDVALAQVPPDIEALRREDPDVARAWRQALRRVLHGSMGSGWTVTGFGRDGWYVLTREGSEVTGEGSKVTGDGSGTGR